MLKSVHVTFLSVFLMACGSTSLEQTNTHVNEGTSLFTLLDPRQTGIDFVNHLEESNEMNLHIYEYAYNGGGVGIGDINNDGLADIYFTGAMSSNKLYLNRGEWQFEDISERAGVAAAHSWCTGVTMVDINADGYLDIYVSRAFGDQDVELRRNLLFINQGDLTFNEEAAAFGLNDISCTSQATFLDFDKDGDLDAYVANYPREFLFDFEERIATGKKLNPELSDHFYRNEGNNTFVDITREAGILNYGFALGLVASDLNKDGWTDIYVANDFEEPDKLYLNNGDGTFSNTINEQLHHISNFGMGSDLADFNNDGLLDIVVLDMMAENNYRQKTQMASMNPRKFWEIVRLGYHYQYMRNTLQLNNGNGTYSEIGYLAGLANTDWSWAPLLADFDNDGWKDLFVTNGYRRDARDKDYEKKLEELSDPNTGVFESTIEEYLALIPSTKIRNYYFRNEGDLRFSDQSQYNGFSDLSFSNGAAYGDLDNDGDLDLVVNNLLEPAFVYRNNVSDLHPNYLRVQLKGSGANLFGFGTKIRLEQDANIQYQELTATRGFQSSVEPILHFGLGKSTKVNLLVTWPDGRVQELKDVSSKQVLVLKQSDATHDQPAEVYRETMFVAIVNNEIGIDFVHTENDYDDYALEILLPHKMSQFGPSVATGDVNGDGIEDFYVGGASWQAGVLYIQSDDGQFHKQATAAFEKDKAQEDLGTLLFDADNDGDLDLYVVSGGNSYPTGSSMLQDRLYVNDGKGNFKRSDVALPVISSSGSCVIAGDYDQDGDLDLFVGGRLDRGRYPHPAASYILQNQDGVFKNVTSGIAPELSKVGMVSSAVWSDHNNDGALDLLVVGEWMPITIFTNRGATFEKSSLAESTGWWNKIVSGDFDGDGDMDYVAGNLGLNYKYKVSAEEPLHVYCSDFDQNGSLDIVLGYYNDGTCYPVRGRQCSSEQIPNIKNKFPTYDSFGKASLADVYGDELKSALHYRADLFASSFIQNDGKGGFSLKALPTEAQLSTMFGIIPSDLDGDGHLDLLTAGNFYVSEVETGRADAGIGLYMKGDGKGGFAPVKPTASGFLAREDVRDLVTLTAADGSTLILVVNNNSRLQIYRLNRPDELVLN